jgi:hypothetical protein
MAIKSSISSLIANSKTSLLVFLMSAGTFLFYFVEKFVLVDVYRFAFTGAIYEILWLPMLLSLLLVPIAGLFMLINKQGNKWLALLSMLLIGAAILILLK